MPLAALQQDERGNPLLPERPQADDVQLSINHNLVRKYMRLLPERRYDNPYTFRYDLYNNHEGTRDQVVSHIVRGIYDQPDFDPEQMELAPRQLNKRIHEEIKNEILADSYTGEDLTESMVRRMVDLGDYVPFRAPNHDIEEGFAGNRIMWELKMASDRDAQRAVLQQDMETYRKMVSEKHPHLNKEFNEDGFIQGFLLYNRYGPDMLGTFSDFLENYDPEKHLDKQVPEVWQAHERLSKRRDRDGFTAMEFLGAFMGDDEHPMGRFRVEPGDLTDDLKYRMPADFNRFTKTFYDTSTDHDRMSFSGAVSAMMPDKRIRNLVESGELDFDHPQVTTRLASMAIDGDGFDIGDLLSTVTANTRFDGDEDREVFFIGPDMPEHARLAAEVLRLVDPSMFHVNDRGELVMEPNRMERIANDPFIGWLRAIRSSRVYTTERDKWGNVIKLDSERRGGLLSFFPAAMIGMTQTFTNIGVNSADWLGERMMDMGQYAPNILAGAIGFRSAKDIYTATQFTSFDTDDPDRGVSLRDIADYDFGSEVRGFSENAGLFTGTLAGYVVGSYKLGVPALTGMFRTAAAGERAARGIRRSMSQLRTAKNMSNAGVLLPQSTFTLRMASMEQSLRGVPRAWTMAATSAGFAGIEVGTGQKPEHSMFGSGFADQAISFVGQQFGLDPDTNIQARYLAANSFVRWGLDFVAGELLGTLFDGVHGLTRSGIGYVAPHRLRGKRWTGDGYDTENVPRYMPFPSWQRNWEEAKHAWREGASEMAVHKGDLGKSMAKFYGTTHADTFSFRSENMADVVVSFTEKGHEWMRNIDQDIAANLRHYDEIFGAAARDEEQLARAVQNVKENLMTNLGKSVREMVGDDNARLFAEMLHEYNPGAYRQLSSPTGTGIFSGAEVERYMTDNAARYSDHQGRARRQPIVEHVEGGEDQYRIYQPENYDWASDVAAGVERSLARVEIDEAINRALDARGIDPNNVTPERMGEADEIIRQVTEVHGRRVEYDAADPRLAPDGPVFRDGAKRHGHVQTIDSEGRLVVLDQDGKTVHIQMDAGQRPIDPAAQMSENRVRAAAGHVEYQVGDRVQLQREGKNLLPDDGGEVLHVQRGPDGQPDLVRIDGISEPVPAQRLSLISRDENAQPGPLTHLAPNVRKQITRSLEDRFVSDGGANPAAETQLRILGYDDGQISRLRALSSDRAAQRSAGGEQNAERTLTEALKTGDQRQIGTVLLSWKESGESAATMTRRVRQYYQAQKAAKRKIIDRHPGDDLPAPRKAARSRAESELEKIEVNELATLRNLDNIMQTDGRLASRMEAEQSGATTTAATRQADRRAEAKSVASKQNRKTKRDEVHRQKQNDARLANRAQNKELPQGTPGHTMADARKFGVPDVVVRTIKDVSKGKTMRKSLTRVMEKLGGLSFRTVYDNLQHPGFAKTRKKSGSPVIEMYNPVKGDPKPGTIVMKQRDDSGQVDYYIRTDKRMAKDDRVEPSFFVRVVDEQGVERLSINEHWRPVNHNQTFHPQRGGKRFRMADDEQRARVGAQENELVVVRASDAEDGFFINVQRPVKVSPEETRPTRATQDLNRTALENDVDGYFYGDDTYRLVDSRQIVDPAKLDAEIDVTKTVPITAAERSALLPATLHTDPTSGGNVPRLPQDLRGAKPRYGYGDKLYQLNFESDTDRALYIVAQRNRSRADERYMTFLRGVFPKLDDAQIRNMGQQVKDEVIKPRAAEGEGGVLNIPRWGELAAIGGATGAVFALDQVVDFDDEMYNEAGWGALGLLALSAVAGRGRRVTGKVRNAVKDGYGKRRKSSWENMNEKTFDFDGQRRKVRELDQMGVSVGDATDPSAVEKGYRMADALSSGIRATGEAFKSVMNGQVFKSDFNFFKKMGVASANQALEFLIKIPQAGRVVREQAARRFNEKYGSGALQRYYDKEFYEDFARLTGMSDPQMAHRLANSVWSVIMNSRTRVRDGKLEIVEMRPNAAAAMTDDTIRRGVEIMSANERFIDFVDSFRVGLFENVASQYHRAVGNMIAERFGSGGTGLHLGGRQLRVKHDGKVKEFTNEEFVELVRQMVRRNDSFEDFMKVLRQDDPAAAALMRNVRSKGWNKNFNKIVNLHNSRARFTDLSGWYWPQRIDWNSLQARRKRYVDQQVRGGADQADAQKQFDSILWNEFFQINKKAMKKGGLLQVDGDGQMNTYSAQQLDKAGMKMRNIIASHDQQTRMQIREFLGGEDDQTLLAKGLIVHERTYQTNSKGQTKLVDTYRLAQPEQMLLKRRGGDRESDVGLFDLENWRSLEQARDEILFNNTVMRSKFLENPRNADLPISWLDNSPRNIFEYYTNDVGTRLHFLKRGIAESDDFQTAFIRPMKEELTSKVRDEMGHLTEEHNHLISNTMERVKTVFDQMSGIVREVEATEPAGRMAKLKSHLRNTKFFLAARDIAMGMYSYGFSWLDLWQPFITTAVYTSARQVRGSYNQIIKDKQFLHDLINTADDFSVLLNKAAHLHGDMDRMADPFAFRGDAVEAASNFTQRWSQYGANFSFGRKILPFLGVDIDQMGIMRLATDNLVGTNQVQTAVNMHSFLAEATELARVGRRLIEEGGEGVRREDGQVYTMARVERELELLGVSHSDAREFIRMEAQLSEQMQRFGTGQRFDISQMDVRHQQIVHDILSTSTDTYHGTNKMMYPTKWATPVGRAMSTFIRFPYNVALQSTQRRVRDPINRWMSTYSGRDGNPDLSKAEIGRVLFHFNRMEFDRLREMGWSDQAIQQFPAEAFQTVNRMFYANGINVAGFMSLGVLKDIVAMPFNELSGNEQFMSLTLNPGAPRSEQMSLLDLFGDEAGAMDALRLGRYLMGKSGLYMGLAGSVAESGFSWGFGRMQPLDLAPPIVNIFERNARDAMDYVGRDYSQVGEWLPGKFVTDIMKYIPVMGSRMVPRREIQQALNQINQTIRDAAD